MANRQRHSAICLATKIAIIEAVEASDKSKSEVAKLFDIPKSSLSSILKKKMNSDNCFVRLRLLSLITDYTCNV